MKFTSKQVTASLVTILLGCCSISTAQVQLEGIATDDSVRDAVTLPRRAVKQALKASGIQPAPVQAPNLSGQLAGAIEQGAKAISTTTGPVLNGVSNAQIAPAVGSPSLDPRSLAPQINGAQVSASPISGGQILAPPQPAMRQQPLTSAKEVVDGLTNAIEDTSADKPEIVRERYDNRKVKVEREVVQDKEQNYINHGKYKTFDPSGKTIVEGRYKYGEMDGVWTRLYYTRDSELLNKAPFNQGQLPLVSQANFVEGKLHGKWVIFDAHKRRLCEWEFTDGKRDGVSTWWYASGMKMREIGYKDGVIDGELNEWDRSSQQVTNDTYVDGSRVATKTETFANRTKRAEGTVLYPKLVLEGPDNWLECRLATYSQDGQPVKHGVWTSWYANGQKKLEGQYEKDVPTGKFTWWHENGQKSLQAHYRDGKKHGSWIWWHDNGLKSIQGEYAGDTPINNWLWWKESGKVAQRADFNDPKQRHILAMPDKSDVTVPSATRARPVTIIK